MKCLTYPALNRSSTCQALHRPLLPTESTGPSWAGRRANSWRSLATHRSVTKASSFQSSESLAPSALAFPMQYIALVCGALWCLSYKVLVCAAHFSRSLRQTHALGASESLPTGAHPRAKTDGEQNASCSSDTSTNGCPQRLSANLKHVSRKCPPQSMLYRCFPLCSRV